MRKRRLIILTALEMEARAAAAAFKIPFVRDAVLKPATGLVEIHTIGMGAVRLPLTLPTLELSKGDSVWMVGLAGALDPALRVGDVVIDAGPAGLDRQHWDERMRQGRIHTSDRLIATPAEKQALFAQTAALAVDMEQELVRDALGPLGISVVGIRAISDTAATSLDPALPRLIDPVGRPKWPVLGSALLRRPALVVSLIRLGKDSSRAAARLTQALAQLTGSDPGLERQ